MNAVALLLDRKRVALTVALALSAAGLASWFTMPREEDPRLHDRFGLLIVPFPGADPETIERLVVEPIEDQLAEVAEIHRVVATARAGVAVTQIQLEDDVDDVDSAWDEVRRALVEAQADLPEGVLSPQLDTHVVSDQDAVVLAITGSPDLSLLRRAAREVRRRLLAVPGVSKVELEPDPGEQITIEWDDRVAVRLGISAEALARQLEARNRSIPGGAVHLGDRALLLEPTSEFQSLDDLADTPVVLPSGSAVPLRSLATVRYGPTEPAESRMRWDGAPGVGVSVVPKANIDVVELGRSIRRELTSVRSAVAPLVIDEMSFQPDYVEARLSGLGASLISGAAIVALVLIVFMGLRLGAVVAAVVPLVSLASLGLYALGGGVLHQLSVAAMVLALGMLVDNAIVVAESVQQGLDRGISNPASAAVRELAFPLLTATGTTVAAFVPMAMSSGSTGEFTRAIPIVVMLTLVVSYVFAVVVTPVLAATFLRPRARGRSRRIARFSAWASLVSSRRPKTVLFAAGVAVALAGAGALFVDRSFFPDSGRDQLVVEMLLPEGSHLDAIDQSARVLETRLAREPSVLHVAAFVGRSTPRFYYNLPNRPKSPHFAQLMVRTRSPEDVDALMDRIEEIARAELPEVEVIPRRLEQGPPLESPVEVRLYGDRLPDLYEAAERVMATLRAIPGAAHVRHDLGIGAPTIAFAVDDAAAGRRGTSRALVSAAVLRQTRGTPAGQLRSGDDPVPIVLRDGAGESMSPDRLDGIYVTTERGSLLPVGQVAAVSARWRPAVIHRRDRRRVVTVAAQLASGVPYSRVLDRLIPALGTTDLPAGVRWELGGNSEGSGDANRAIVVAAPLGAVLLLLFILIEFNSFRRLGIIMTTVPLAAAGVVPGLLLAGQPFGFMSLLGVIALVGVVVNNAIVLIDVADHLVAQGRGTVEAMRRAIFLRTRPIFLTTTTTVAGMVPLLLSDSPLWPPLASAMIAGLIASTLLTLVVVPACYLLLLPSNPDSMRRMNHV